MVVVANLLLVLITVAIGGTLGRGYAEMALPLVGVYALVNWVFVGIAEELLGRGYLQTKLPSLIGGATVARTNLGIVVAALPFALWHVPQRLVVAGLTVDQLPANPLVLVGLGVFFGVLYEITGNLILTGLLHGAYNFAPIAVSVHSETIATWLQVVLLLALVGPFLIGVLLYARLVPDVRASIARQTVVD